MKKRASERLFPAALKDRADRVRGKGMRGDYFAKGAKFGNVHCRSCDVLIAEGGRLLSNYRNVELEWDGGGKHKTNMCVTCAEKLDFNDEDTIEAILVSDFESWARTDERAGVTTKEHQKMLKGLHDRKLKQGGRVIVPGVGEK